jgi:carbon starvation protein CstA
VAKEEFGIAGVMRKQLALTKAEKSGVIAAAFVAAVCAYLAAVLLVSTGQLRAPRLEAAIFRWFIYSELAVALPVWLLLRTLDLARDIFRHRLSKRAATRPAVIGTARKHFF